MTDKVKTVLVADDSPTMRRMIAWVLIPMGLEVVEAADGREAMKVLEERPIDLAIVDINMPVMDGIQLMRRIRGKPELQGLPVLMLTTESREQERKLAEEAGVNMYQTKPCLPPEIRAKVFSLLEAVDPDVGSAPEEQGRTM